MNSVDFMLKFDKGIYNENINYVGPFWVCDSLLVVLSQDFSVNYLAYLHDCAYETPKGHKADDIDFHFISAIIEETGNIELASVYGSWIKALNFISWYQSRIIEWWVGFIKK